MRPWLARDQRPRWRTRLKALARTAAYRRGAARSSGEAGARDRARSTRTLERLLEDRLCRRRQAGLDFIVLRSARLALGPRRLIGDLRKRGVRGGRAERVAQAVDSGDVDHLRRCTVDCTSSCATPTVRSIAKGMPECIMRCFARASTRTYPRNSSLSGFEPPAIPRPRRQMRQVMTSREIRSVSRLLR